MEMMDRLEGRASYLADDERLQRRFKSLLAAEPLWGTSARPGRDFLRRHARLLEEAPAHERETESVRTAGG
jgi:hypothetical protein